jgi:DNA-directed RNA polymerase specialized sigma24 family protein
VTALQTERAVMLEDYRAARIADEQDEEDRTLGYATERAMQRAAGVRQPLTLTDWIRQGQRPAPGPDDAAAVRAAELTKAIAAHSDADEARERYEEAARERAAVFAELVAAGWSLADIARSLGISRAAVHAVVRRARSADTGAVL